MGLKPTNATQRVRGLHLKHPAGDRLTYYYTRVYGCNTGHNIRICTIAVFAYCCICGDKIGDRSGKKIRVLVVYGTTTIIRILLLYLFLLKAWTAVERKSRSAMAHAFPAAVSYYVGCAAWRYSILLWWVSESSALLYALVYSSSLVYPLLLISCCCGCCVWAGIQMQVVPPWVPWYPPPPALPPLFVCVGTQVCFRCLTSFCVPPPLPPGRAGISYRTISSSRALVIAFLWPGRPAAPSAPHQGRAKQHCLWSLVQLGFSCVCSPALHFRDITSHKKKITAVVGKQDGHVQDVDV